MRLAPGPKGWPLIGCLSEFAQDPLQFWLGLTQRFGLVAQYPIGHKRHYLISDPTAIAHVFRYDTDRYYRGKYHDFLKPAFGEGLLTTNDGQWRQQRHWVKPFFRRQPVRDWLDIIIDSTCTHIQTWRQQDSSFYFDIAPAFAALIQEINAKILFGRYMDYQAHSPLLAAVNGINDSLLRQVKRAMILGGLLNHLPFEDVRRFRQSINCLHETIDQLVARYKTSEDPQALYTYLRQTAATSGLNDKTVLRDQAITLFLAGHETTAIALGWMVYYLSDYPEWQERLHGEITTLIGDNPPTATDDHPFPLMQSVISEVLRLRPPIYGIGRRARVEDEINGYTIPANSPVIISPYVVHHHPDFWAAPDQFNPERFLERKAEEQIPFTYFPFGGGPHLCIGRHLAMLELTTVMVLVLQAFRLITPPGRQVSMQPWITLRPKPGIPIRLQPH